MKSWSKEIFAKNRKQYLEWSGKTQKEIAEIAGVSTSIVSDWMRAKKYPRIEKIGILANYFGILKSDLIEDKRNDDVAKSNDTIYSIIVRLRMDEEFYHWYTCCTKWIRKKLMELNRC